MYSRDVKTENEQEHNYDGTPYQPYISIDEVKVKHKQAIHMYVEVVFNLVAKVLFGSLIYSIHWQNNPADVNVVKT